MVSMWFNCHEKKTINYDALILELQDLIIKQYSQYGVTLLEKNNTSSLIELRFNVEKKELINMLINEQ